LGPPVNNPPELSNNPLVQNLESKTNENVDKVEIENPNNIDIINAPSYFTLEAKLKKLHKTQKNLKSAAKKCKVSNQNTSLNENIQELNDSIKSTTESILSFEKTIKPKVYFLLRKQSKSYLMIKRNFIYPQIARKTIFILMQRISKILKIQILSLSPGLDQKNMKMRIPLKFHNLKTKIL